MILLIDNFDSFTYNIAQALETLGERVEVHRPGPPLPNRPYSKIVIGPGPGKPEDALFSLEILEKFIGKVPILGVCLGHQCLAHFFSAKVICAKFPMHGKISPITHDGKGVFESLKNPLNVVRYHSLIVDPATVPSDLIVTARTDSGEIMGLRHKKHPVESVQFHPDSILTEGGLQMFSNFIKLGFLGGPF